MPCNPARMDLRISSIKPPRLSRFLTRPAAALLPSQSGNHSGLYEAFAGAAKCSGARSPTVRSSQSHWRRLEAGAHRFEHRGAGDGRPILVGSGNDLHAARQAILGKQRRSDGGRQTRAGGKASPWHQVKIWPLPAINLDNPRVRIGRLIVPDRAGGSWRTQHHVEAFEKPRPLPLKTPPAFLDATKILRIQAHPARL